MQPAPQNVEKVAEVVRKLVSEVYSGDPWSRCLDTVSEFMRSKAAEKVKKDAVTRANDKDRPALQLEANVAASKAEEPKPLVDFRQSISGSVARCELELLNKQ